MKLSFTKVFFLIILFSNIDIAAANEWRLIARTETAQFFIETTALSYSGNEKLIKIKRNEVQGERSPASLELTYLINCSENTVSLMAAKQFKELDFQGDGKSVNVPNPPNIVEAKQGTTASSFVKAACEQSKQGASAPSKQITNAQQVAPSNATFKIVNVSNLTKNEFAKLCTSNSPVSKNIINRIESNERENAGAFFEKKLNTDFYITWSGPNNECYLTVTPRYQSTALLPGNSSGRTHSLLVTQFAIYPDGKSFIYEANYKN